MNLISAWKRLAGICGLTKLTRANVANKKSELVVDRNGRLFNIKSRYRLRCNPIKNTNKKSELDECLSLGGNERKESFLIPDSFYDYQDSPEYKAAMERDRLRMESNIGSSTWRYYPDTNKFVQIS